MFFLVSLVHQVSSPSRVALIMQCVSVSLLALLLALCVLSHSVVASSPAEGETSLLELGVEVSADAADPGLFYDSANGQGMLRAPYLPATVNGPMYPRTGPQSGMAKGWLGKAAQPAWNALPYGPRTPSAMYVLPFDHMREVQDEFSWNYDHNAPKAPPQFAFAAPIFLEQSETQHAEVQQDAESEGEEQADAEADADESDSAETDADADAESEIEYVMAIEVDDLASYMGPSSTPSLVESTSTVSSTHAPAPQLISNDFWSGRGVFPAFNSYTNPYHDLVHPTLPGSNQDGAYFGAVGGSGHPYGVGVGSSRAFGFGRAPYEYGQSSIYGLGRRAGMVAHPMPYAYHSAGYTGTMPPYAHRIEPWKHISTISPSQVSVGENEPETFLTE